MESKLFFRTSTGKKVCGVLSSPKESTDVPIVVLCHGLNSGKDSKTNLEIKKILDRNGIATLRFDFFGHGESEGDPKDRNVAEFVEDILGAFAYLRGRGYPKMGIFGASFGGVAAVIAVSKWGDIKLMALKSPGMGKTSRNMPNYKKDFDSKRWFVAGKKISIPTLIVHGSIDEDVEVELGKRLADSIETSRIVIIEGANHRYSREGDFDKAVGLITEFITENMSD